MELRAGARAARCYANEGSKMSGERLSRPAGQSHSMRRRGRRQQTRAGLPGTRRADGRQRREIRREGERERRVKLETLDCAEVGGARQGGGWVEGLRAEGGGRWAVGGGCGGQVRQCQ